MIRSIMTAACRTAARRHGPVTASAARHLSANMRQKLQADPIPQEVIDAIPDFPMQTVYGGDEYDYKTPVTSAHMIEGDKVSTLDSVAISPDGAVLHGRYGPLAEPAASSIPLEFLALLRPAAEGAAAMRILNSKSGGKKGTVLVYGVSMANGLAAAQLANAAGNAVVGVVTSHHSGNDDLVFSIKHMFDEPGTAVPEEFALSKALFRDLVKNIATGDEGYPENDPETYLKEFKELFVEYCEAYPDTRPAAVSEKELEFKYMEKDRDNWDLNMEAYLSQFSPGAPPVDQAKLGAFFTSLQYEIFRQKFWQQTSLLICDEEQVGDVPDFSPPHVVQGQCQKPEELSRAVDMATGYPFQFSIFNKKFPEEMNVTPGGPVMGAVICVTPELAVAANAVGKAGDSVRAKAEALQFCTKFEKDAYQSALSVVQNAAGAPIVVLGGSVPGFESVTEATDADVQEALSALDLDEAGNTRLNFFVQSYRASDFPFYADYAIHRANEVLAGPRQTIVLK